MKIGFVLDDGLDKPDGVQQYVLTLGKWFASEGHEVHYLVGYTQRNDLTNVHSLSKNIQVRFNHNNMSTPLPASPRKIRRLLNREKFDVLHVQLPYSPFLAGTIINNAPARTAIVGTFHILPFSRIESLATRVLSWVLLSSRRKFDKVVSVSKPAQIFASEKFGTQSIVLPNAVDVASFRTNQNANPKKSKKLRILYLGRLVERKGCMQLLKALQLLNIRQSLSNVEVLIGGKGPLREELEEFVGRNGLSELVTFIGFVQEQDKASLLQSADIVALPSTGGESFGIVLVEAMAAGAGVVLAGDNPGYRTVMEGHDDQVVDPSDIQSFSETIGYYINDKKARQSAKIWQEERANEYDVSVVGPGLLKIYKEVLLMKQSVR